jgi:hypothetical protein
VYQVQNCHAVRVGSAFVANVVGMLADDNGYMSVPDRVFWCGEFLFFREDLFGHLMF